MAFVVITLSISSISAALNTVCGATSCYK